jgi:hypothetical protein
MPKTTAFANEIVNAFLRNVAPSIPATCYVALFTADPTAAGLVTNEVAASTGYARAAATFSAASGGATANTGAITFGPDSGTNWGTVTHFALCKGGTRAVADLMYTQALTASQAVVIGESGGFAIGAITLTES